MLAHFKPDDGSQATFDADVRAVLTGPSLKALHRRGLFALSFMDSDNLDGQPATLDFVAQAVSAYGLGSASRKNIRFLIRGASRASAPKGKGKSRKRARRNSCR
jgi:hypothetical protein